MKAFLHVTMAGLVTDPVSTGVPQAGLLRPKPPSGRFKGTSPLKPSHRPFEDYLHAG